MAREPLTLLWSDPWLAAFSKPSGLAVHQGIDRDPVTAAALARQALGRPVFAVHRLDKATSGVWLTALDADSAAQLGAQWQSGAVRKRYLAVVRGALLGTHTVDHPIRPGGEGEAVPAVTRVRGLACGEGRTSLVEAEPLSGRRHQIRLHTKHLSHPVAGDTTHGDLRYNRALRDVCGLSRLALHAAELEFAHPHTGQRVAIVATLPASLLEPMERLGLSEAASEWFRGGDLTRAW
jgi:tRNA pseudouridine65 synthase